ncbi:hypothetical protein, partial [Streptomyces minutiscleroticus]|uniref:hypothetical protein n=1 Tax=Streptomyces minutiscleroticus TaxID=68238 RepID=UPI00331FD65A
ASCMASRPRLLAKALTSEVSSLLGGPAAGIPTGAPGVVTGDSGATVLEQVSALLGKHRVWDRFTPQV